MNDGLDKLIGRRVRYSANEYTILSVSWSPEGPRGLAVSDEGFLTAFTFGVGWQLLMDYPSAIPALWGCYHALCWAIDCATLDTSLYERLVAERDRAKEVLGL